MWQHEQQSRYHIQRCPLCAEMEDEQRKEHSIGWIVQREDSHDEDIDQHGPSGKGETPSQQHAHDGEEEEKKGGGFGPGENPTGRWQQQHTQQDPIHMPWYDIGSRTGHPYNLLLLPIKRNIPA